AERFVRRRLRRTRAVRDGSPASPNEAIAWSVSPAALRAPRVALPLERLHGHRPAAGSAPRPLPPPQADRAPVASTFHPGHAARPTRPARPFGRLGTAS